jgi:hypothetical protein
MAGLSPRGFTKYHLIQRETGTIRIFALYREGKASQSVVSLLEQESKTKADRVVRTERI